MVFGKELAEGLKASIAFPNLSVFKYRVFSCNRLQVNGSTGELSSKINRETHAREVQFDGGGCTTHGVYRHQMPVLFVEKGVFCHQAANMLSSGPLLGEVSYPGSMKCCYC